MADGETTPNHDGGVKRTCRTCGIQKPLNDFAKCKKNEEARRRKCRACRQAALTPEQREKAREYGRAYAAANKEEARARHLRWRKANPELYRASFSSKHKDQKVIAYKREWERNNRDMLREKRAIYYLANKGRIQAQQKVYREENPDLITTIRRNIKAQRKSLPGKHTVEDINALFAAQKSQCAICRGKLRRDRSTHVDHIIPCKLGGRNDRSNLQLLCAPCNLSKAAKDPIDFMQSRGFLL